MIENFRDKALQMGKEVVIKLEGDATLEDVQDVDLVVSLGGDHTFLRASALI